MKHSVFSALVGLAVLGGVSAAGANQPIIVPRGDQSQDQLKKDRVECQVFAVDTSGFDPMNAAAPGRGD